MIRGHLNHTNLHQLDGRNRWLSVDNAHAQNPALLQEDGRRRFFADRTLLHFHQSDYARRFIEAAGGVSFPLSDYTDLDFIHQSLMRGDTGPTAQRERTIAWFPNKGAGRASRFMERASLLAPGTLFAAIQGMTKQQVRNKLFSCPLYIDFGHHPGKDRVPREAAMAGAVVLLHREGAGNCSTDHQIPDCHRFDEADIVSGRLHALVNDIFSNIEPHLSAQRVYRQSILLEEARFELEVKTLFFEGCLG